MTKTKPTHTPGPWTFWNGQIEVSDETDQIAVIADIHMWTKHFDEAVANARLIAAAPTMMSALREALLLAQETEHAESARLQKLFTEVLIQAGDEALREVYGRE